MIKIVRTTNDNDEKVISFKKEKFVRKTKEIKDRTKWWFIQNKTKIVNGSFIAAGLFITLGLPTIKLVNETRTKIRLEKIERDKLLRMYDRSLGCYIDLKRQLTSTDLKTINARKAGGERLVDILDDLKLIRD